jgi:hypothetical protein
MQFADGDVNIRNFKGKMLEAHGLLAACGRFVCCEEFQACSAKAKHHELVGGASIENSRTSEAEMTCVELLLALEICAVEGYVLNCTHIPLVPIAE